MVLTRRKFTLEEYHRLAELGFLSEDDRVELVDGEIITMSPIDKIHSACVSRSSRKLIQQLGDKAVVYVQNPVIILEDELQPDIAVLAPNPTDYADRAASAEDVILIIEVANTSLSYDRTVKAPKYARAGVEDFWIVDLIHERIWVYRQPDKDSYLQMTAHHRDEMLSILAFPNITLNVDAFFG